MELYSILIKFSRFCLFLIFFNIILYPALSKNNNQSVQKLTINKQKYKTGVRASIATNTGILTELLLNRRGGKKTRQNSKYQVVNQRKIE